MEVIKTTIHQLLTTGITTTTTGNQYIIIPDTGATYYVKFGLTSTDEEIGFFDAYTLPDYTGDTTITPILNYPQVTGTSTSRLAELRKYTITNVFSKQYITGGTTTTDGVDVPNSNTGSSITYYLGGIKYVDVITGASSGITFNYFIPQGITSANFINVPYYKNPNKENIISQPNIDDDVFISRQQVSAFDKNYRLEYIKNLSDLTTYAGGNFFNIVNNL